jgi:hypothetical protein
MLTRLVTGAVVAGIAAAAPAAAGADVAVTNTLTFARPDASTVVFPENVRIWCGRWEDGVPTRTLHVWFGGRRRSAFWHLQVVVADVRRDPVVELPHTFVFDRPSGAQLFAVDGTNELSTGEEEARGRIVFSRVRCGRRLAVRFRMRGRLGSEFFDGEELSVRGSFSARVRPPRAP